VFRRWVYLDLDVPSNAYGDFTWRDFKMLYKKIEKIINTTSDVTGYMGAFAIVCAALILTYEVVFRYLYNAPTIWEIEASVFLLMFSGFIGASFVLKNNAHINIKLITSRLSSKTQMLLDIITSILSFLFCVAMTYRAWPMWWEAYDLGWVSESLWGPPLWIPYLFLPVGFTIISAQYVVHILKSIEKYKLYTEK